MPYLVGQIIGGVLLIYLLALLWEWALFQRVVSDPVFGKLSSVLAAWLCAAAISGWGHADGGPYDWSQFGKLMIPAVVVGVMAYHRGSKILDAQSER